MENISNSQMDHYVSFSLFLHTLTLEIFSVHRGGNGK